MVVPDAVVLVLEVLEVVLDGVVLVLEEEAVVLVLEEEEVVLVLEEEVLVVLEVDVVEPGTQDSVSLAIVPVIGRCIAETGVPGGKFTSNVSVWPSASVTVTTHGSAAALRGSAPIPSANSEPAAATTASLRRLDTVALVPPAINYALLRLLRWAASSSMGIPMARYVAECAHAVAKSEAEHKNRRSETNRRPPGRRGTVAAVATRDDKGLRERMTRQGEEAIGKLAQELLENPVVSRALSAAFETRERASRAQEVAMGALNLPSASDLERLTRRLRAVSQRLEGIEDGLDRVEQRVDGLSAGTVEQRLTAIEEALGRIEAARRQLTAGV